MSLDSNNNQRSRKAELLALAEGGNANAQYELGMLYITGDSSTSPNHIAAQRWLKQAALQQHDQASDEIKRLQAKSKFSPLSAISLAQSGIDKPNGKAIPNDQLRNVTNILKQTNQENQLKNILPKPNVHTPLSEIYRQFHEPNLEEPIENQPLPPTIKHLEKNAKKNHDNNDKPKKEHSSEENQYETDGHLDLLKLLPPDIIAKINGLVGLFEVKKTVTDLIFKSYQAKRKKKSYIPNYTSRLPSMLFVGNPGCGKSVVSDILAKVFNHLELIKSDQYLYINIETILQLSVTDLTKEISLKLKENEANVIIVDNMQLLTKVDNPKKGQVILELLRQYKMKQPNNILIIGSCQRYYINDLTSIYPKLNALFEVSLKFSDLNACELTEIYQKRLDELNLTITADALYYMNELFQTLYRTRSHNFKNSHLVEMCIKQQLSAIDAKSPNYMLTLEDVQL
ncbi:AAA family ATPase [Thiotrichales bacterium 19S9-12]|nr:AAA family ATPase [Thiotrichales bacterium 19S9-11]MCF6812214.1 AAA family ATPase [Thiotrichales bacterium 19S9-12]